jgi:hypothetical protein
MKWIKFNQLAAMTQQTEAWAALPTVAAAPAFALESAPFYLSSARPGPLGSMEVNLIRNALHDIKARVDALRGYL